MLSGAFNRIGKILQAIDAFFLAIARETYPDGYDHAGIQEARRKLERLTNK